jgi:hypothetical protein
MYIGSTHVRLPIPDHQSDPTPSLVRLLLIIVILLHAREGGAVVVVVVVVVGDVDAFSGLVQVQRRQGGSRTRPESLVVVASLPPQRDRRHGTCRSSQGTTSVEERVR